MKPAILCVDDDPGILEGYRRILGRDFEPYLARGGWQGLMKMDSGIEFPVVVADMLMPDMDGIEFLRRVRQRSPDSVRIMLSGDGQHATALAAVNVGNVFAFLAKPCPVERLLETIHAAVDHWNSRQEERQERQSVMVGCVHALTQMMRAARPVVYRRSERVHTLGRGMLDALTLPVDWQMDAALWLGHSGCLSLGDTLLLKIEEGAELDPQETAAFETHPGLAMDWLQDVPNFEALAEAIQLQRSEFSGSSHPSAEALPLASRVLRVAGDFDWLSAGGRRGSHGLERLRAHAQAYDPALLDALERLLPALAVPAQAAR